MISSQPITRSFLVMLVVIGASCSNQAPVTELSPNREVNPPDAAPPPSTTATAGNTAGMAGTTGPTPVVDAGDANMEPMPVVDAGSPNGTDEDDAGTWKPPELECENDRWRLAPGFLLAERVNYVADRMLVLPTHDPSVMVRVELLSENGVRCEDAKDRATCESAVDLQPPFIAQRHLLTTAGDTVRLWDQNSIMKLFGLFDTPAEVLWWLETARGYIARCNVTITESGGFYRVEGLVTAGACGSPPPPDFNPEKTAIVEVNRNGNTRELRYAEVWQDPACTMSVP